ncbi:uncharacterized protein LOC144158623 isoform X1 [Haemaphysalis longicornis]
MGSLLLPAEVASYVLKWGPLLMVLLFGLPQTDQNNFPKLRRGPCFTLLDIVHLVLLVFSTTLAVTKGRMALGYEEMNKYLSLSRLREASADFAMAASLFILGFIMRRRRKLGLPPSGFATTVLGMLFTACVLDVFRQFTAPVMLQELLLSTVQTEQKTIIVSCLMVATAAGIFIGAEIQDLIIKAPIKKEELLDEDTMSIFGRSTCVSIFPLLKAIVRRKPTTNAIPPLRRGVRCRALTQAFTAELEHKKNRPGQRRSFVFALMKVLWVDILRMVLATAAYYAVLFGRIPALELLINSNSHVGMLTAVLLFAAATTAELLVSCYHMDLLNMFGSRSFSILQGIIFSKILTMTAGARTRYPTGKITLLMSVDASMVITGGTSIPVPLFGAVTLPIVFWMLASRAGVGPALCCAAYVVFVLCLPFVTSCLQRSLWAKAIRVRDERLKAISDLLSTIRVVKMYAWEDAMQENVKRLRDIELGWLFRVNLLDALLDCIYSSTSSVLMIILFSTLSVISPDVVLTPALSFSCVSLLYLTDLTMNGSGQALRNYNQAALSLKRIADFCTEVPQEEEKIPRRASFDELRGTVTMSRCSFSWTQPRVGTSEPQLTNVDLNIEPGSLVGIVGFVGSGKSSLLAAILGDMHRLEGSVSCYGRVAFAPQLPIVHNMTIRDNILYGKPMNYYRYERVIQRCQLMNDLNKLKSGDMTEVGEKGTNMSGGQKQRISLARAVYSQSDVYLLDDPLSALDPVVGSRVFKDVIGKHGVLKDKTRIMVCNQGNILHHMDKLVLVDKGRIKVYNKVDDLLNDPEAPQNLRETFQKKTSNHINQNGGPEEQLEDNKVVGRITQEEKGVSIKTGWQLLRCLVRMSEWPAPLSIFIFCAAACAFALEQLCIKEWTDSGTSGVSDEQLQPETPWRKYLIALCVTDVVLRLLGSVLMAMTAKYVSRTLHRDMMGHVLHSPVSFFDATPRGRILNRFATDMEYIDARTFLSGKQSIQNSLITLAKVAVVGTQSPVVLGVTAVLIVLATFGMNLAVKASHTSRYFCMLATSRLLQHVGETLDAISSVRAYGVTERFRSHFCRLSDQVSQGSISFALAYRFTRSITAAAGFIVVISTLVANTLFAGPGGPDPSSLGLALSSATSVPVSLMTLAIMFFNVLQMVVSYERCVEYSELPEEIDADDAPDGDKSVLSVATLPGWPTEGQVEFHNYTASYRPGLLPDVLSGITFVIRPKEKVGVVGRTGAGKSSLVLAILRMIRPSKGCIIIDGVNTAHVPLRQLRSSITVIPQDPSLVRGTLRMNLDPTNSHSDREVWQCLERTHLAKLASSDGKGLLLETTDGGTNLSVGQRQLVCLARALLRGSRILILDEATSQMDGDTDQLIQVALRAAFADCTVITIAHRIHTVIDYDRILVLEDGKVREFDTVSRLLSDNISMFHNMAVESGIKGARRNSELLSVAL